MTALNNLAALRTYFDEPTLSMTEIKALTKEERADLADQIFEVTGWERAA